MLQEISDIEQRSMTAVFEWFILNDAMAKGIAFKAPKEVPPCES